MRKYKITGMSCAACSARVESAVSRLDGVQSCSVSLLLGSMTVTGDAPEEKIVKAVEGAGYGIKNEDASAAQNGGESAEEKNTDAIRIAWRLISSGVLLIILMYISMGHNMWGAPLPAPVAANPMINGLLQLLLSASVMIINGKFFINGAKGAIHLSPNMDTLVALGSGASFGFSVFLLFMMSEAMLSGDLNRAHELLHGLYFESAAMILVLITVGKLMESYAKGKTTNAIRALLDLTPKMATVIDSDGNEKVIPARELKAGDIFIVRRGENLPSDGEIVEGYGSLDESCLTGESIPQDKRGSQRVFGGTTLLSGFIKVRATEVSDKTVISKIVAMVKEAAGSKAPVAKVADRVAGVFVPFVIICSAVCIAVWLILGESVGIALTRAVSVLVISCPCALGLATPLAIMVGTGVGAGGGMLFKTAESLELAGRVRTVVFDKTGTLTEGHPFVTDVITEGIREEELLRLAASVEIMSEHPLARAIVAEYKEKYQGSDMADLADFKATQGGVSALVLGSSMLIGNISYMEASGVLIPNSIRSKCDSLSEGGKTPLAVAKDGECVGIIALADRAKADARLAVAELKSMGIETVMLTGDNRACARAIATELGIDRVIAEVFPADKAKHVTELRRGGRVAMVGDGVNDAPALTAADLGIAIGRGTDIAIDSASLVLQSSDVLSVCDALRLGRRTLGIIYANLFWAFCYNLVGIPLAAGAFISLLGWSMTPMFGALCMSASSLLVVLSSLSLNLFKYKRIKNTPNTEIKEKKQMKTTRIKIEGMMCPHCSGRVKTALEACPGVVAADVSHERGDAVIEHEDTVARESLERIISEAGYKVVG